MLSVFSDVRAKQKRAIYDQQKKKHDAMVADEIAQTLEALPAREEFLKNSKKNKVVTTKKRGRPSKVSANPSEENPPENAVTISDNVLAPRAVGKIGLFGLNRWSITPEIQALDKKIRGNVLTYILYDGSELTIQGAIFPDLADYALWLAMLGINQEYQCKLTQEEPVSSLGGTRKQFEVATSKYQICQRLGISRPGKDQYDDVDDRLQVLANTRATRSWKNLHGPQRKKKDISANLIDFAQTGDGHDKLFIGIDANIVEMFAGRAEQYYFKARTIWSLTKYERAIFINATIYPHQMAHITENDLLDLLRAHDDAKTKKPLIKKQLREISKYLREAVKSLIDKGIIKKNSKVIPGARNKSAIYQIHKFRPLPEKLEYNALK